MRSGLKADFAAGAYVVATWFDPPPPLDSDYIPELPRGPPSAPPRSLMVSPLAAGLEAPAEPMVFVPDLPLELDVEPDPERAEQAVSRLKMPTVAMSFNML